MKRFIKVTIEMDMDIFPASFIHPHTGFSPSRLQSRAAESKNVDPISKPRYFLGDSQIP